MRKHPLYLGYALAVLGFCSWADYRGISFTRVNEVRNVPRSVRDNPGAYRPVYGGYSRYFGGK